jgi:hypothetical protein
MNPKHHFSYFIEIRYNAVTLKMKINIRNTYGSLKMEYDRNVINENGQDRKNTCRNCGHSKEENYSKASVEGIKVNSHCIFRNLSQQPTKRYNACKNIAYCQVNLYKKIIRGPYYSHQYDYDWNRKNTENNEPCIQF